jgi:HD-like signal output (HDOD) protein
MLGGRLAVATTQHSPRALAHGVLDLVSLPEVYLKVRKLVDDPRSSLADVADALAIDPAMTARILRLTNSAYFGFAGRVTSVPRAVSMLGTQQVHDFVLATSVMRSFAGIPASLVDMRRFWRTSVHCGATAKVLADRCGILDSERIFITGLLAHVGRLVLYLRLPEVARGAHAEAVREHRPISDFERSLLGFDYAEVGGELLAAWNLPPSLVEPVRLHTRPAEGGDFAFEASVVHVGAALAEALDRELPTASVVPQIDETAWQLTRMSEESFDDLRSLNEALSGELAELFAPDRP